MGIFKGTWVVNRSCDREIYFGLQTSVGNVWTIEGIQVINQIKRKQLGSKQIRIRKRKKKEEQRFFQLLYTDFDKKIKKKNKVLLTNQLHPLSSVNYQRNYNKDFKRSV